MNGLNQMIAQGVRPVQIESPLNQMAQFEQIRGAQQANQLRQQQMAEIQRQQQLAIRQQEQTETLNRLYQQAYDPTTGRIDERKLFGGMAEGGFGSQIPVKQEMFGKLRKATADAAKASTESALKRIELKRTQLENVSTADAYVQWALSSFDDPVLAPILQEIGSTPEKIIQHIREVGAQPGGLQRLIEESKLGSEKFAQLVKDRAGQAITVRGQDIQAATTRRGQDIQAATTRRGQDLTERRERDLALAENIAAARTFGTELAKNRVAAEAALPGAIATAEQTLALIDDMIGDARVGRDGKRWEVPKGGRQPAPGFQDYVGATALPFARFIEGSPAAGYERRQLQIEGKTFLEAFESLKGGGAITEVEGAKATQAISRMNKAQSEVEYIKAARELQEVVRNGVERARKKAGAGGAAPAGAPMNPSLMSNEELLRQLGM